MKKQCKTDRISNYKQKKNKQRSCNTIIEIFRKY